MWYSSGTITATNNNTVVIGVGTTFLQNVRVGDGITIAGSTTLHEVSSIASNTQLTIKPAYTGTTGAGKQFACAPLLGYDKDLSDAFNQLRLQFGDKLSSLQPWAYAATVEESRQQLGLYPLLEVKVDKVEGKGLSDTNFTQGEKTRLAGIASEATKNRADSENADRVHTHTMDQVDDLGAVLDNKVNTSNITQTSGQSTTEIMSQKAVTDIFLQYNDSQTGLRWNQETDVYQVLGSIHRTRIQERMRRCVLNDDGTVNYYLDQHDSTKKEDGTPAILDGTDGNVMVEIPKFYYKQHLVGDQHEWWISATPAVGYEVHEAFLKNGVTEVDYVYWAAYRPSTLDDKLMSVSDVAPTVSKNISTFRAEARANGEGWNLPNYHILTAIRLLYLLEYCTFNSQAVLGNGNHAGANYTRTTGVSNILGNESSSPAITGWMSYRGIEDFYASSWQFIDGCGLNNGVFRSTNVEADYNNTLSGDSYVDGASVPTFSATYIKKITSDFLPQLEGGSSTTFTCDGAYSSTSGLRVHYFGGVADLGAVGGVFCAVLYYPFSGVGVKLAAGLSFR